MTSQCGKSGKGGTMAIAEFGALYEQMSCVTKERADEQNP